MRGAAAREIAEDLAPVFVFSSGERFTPLPPAAFPRVSDLFVRRVGRDSDFGHTLRELPTGSSCPKQCPAYLDIANARVKLPNPPAPYRRIQDELLHGARAVVSFRVLRYESRRPAGFTHYTAQYWLLSLFNSLIGDFHEGDLEQVTIHAGPRRHPFAAFYSAHKAGFVRKWQKVESLDGRAVVYVAVGSHANYFGTGPQKTLLQCPKRKGNRDRRCQAVSGISEDYGDGCGPMWVWERVRLSGRPLSDASCRRHMRATSNVVRFALQPWAAHSVDWGAPKAVVNDPSVRRLTWNDALQDMRRNACYDIDRDAH
jgi:hypothetical protein